MRIFGSWSFILVVTIIVVGAPLSSSPESAPSSDVRLTPGLEKAIEQYIRSHPEVIEQSLQALEAKRQEEEKQRVKAAIAARQDELLHDPASPVSGNLSGNVTLVEFFDYRCGYCKRSAGAVTQLQKDDPRVRVIYKDFPILGDASELAAKAALASRAQGKHQAFHEAILAAKTEITKIELLRIADEVGLDTKKLETDMGNPEWQAVIDRNRALANELGINGTPGFIVGTELVPGALDMKGLKELIARADKKK